MAVWFDLFKASGSGIARVPFTIGRHKEAFGVDFEDADEEEFFLSVFGDEDFPFDSFVVDKLALRSDVFVCGVMDVIGF